MRCYRYQRHCDSCIVEAIRKLLDPTDHTVKYLAEEGIILHPETVQVVLDVLDQKFGIS